MIYASGRTERATQQKFLHQELNNHVSRLKKPPQPKNFVERFFFNSPIFRLWKRGYLILGLVRLGLKFENFRPLIPNEKVIL